MKVKVKTGALKHYAFFDNLSETGRPCSHEGCDKNASRINGFYLFIDRRVRVWTCSDHWNGNPTAKLDMPASLKVALQEEEVYLISQRKKLAFNTDPWKMGV